MKISPVLTWKYLTSKVHPPLPLNPRDSQQLLSLLNSSFRSQLDQEHPKIKSHERQAIDVHINSILRSPLFTGPHQQTPSITSKHSDHGDHKLDSIQRLAKSHDNSNAVEQFRQSVASGRADLKAAQICLDGLWESIRDLPRWVRRKEMKASQAGPVILDWLWSSGSTHSLSFLREKKFIGVLMPFIVAERREALVWRWLQLLYKEVKKIPANETGFPSQIHVQGDIIMRLVESQMKCGGNYDTMIKEFLIAVDEISTWSYPHEWLSSVLRPAGALLTRFLVKDPKKSKESSRYLDFVKTAEVWDKEEVFEAFLQIHHPTHPSPAFALRFMKTHGAKSLSSRKNKSLIRYLCLDTVQLLVNNGYDREVKFVMEFLQTNLAPEIASIESTTAVDQSIGEKSRTRDREEWSLQMLDHLAVHMN
ncbi:hypothetical protein MMC14_004559 [Varicellaria rhodocarpa]|nr:hypothetical protein [Varicellaria rhodocarpa]